MSVLPLIPERKPRVIEFIVAPMPSPLNYTPFITQTLQSAGELAITNFGRVTTSTTKVGDTNQVLTETDLAIGKQIIAAVQEAYPSYNIIDEEAGVIDKGSQFTWVVDPIDGTSNFSVGLPTYGIMIGLLDGGTPIAGGIMLPAFNQVFVGQKGVGATCNGQPVHVSQETELISSLIAYGIDGHQEDPSRTQTEIELVGRIVLKIRNLRTTNSAYDMAHVIDGKYGAYLNQTTKIWDNVALQPIVEEAGGIVTDFWGKPMDYSNPLSRAKENFTICAGAPQLHTALQDIIHSI